MISKDVKATSKSGLERDKPVDPPFAFEELLQMFQFDSKDADERGSADERDSAEERDSADQTKDVKATSRSGLTKDKADELDSEDADKKDTADESDNGNEDAKAVSQSDLKSNSLREDFADVYSAYEKLRLQEFHEQMNLQNADDEAYETDFSEEMDTTDESDNGNEDASCHGKFRNSILFVLHKRFKKMAKELEKENPSLKKLAGEFLTMIKHSDTPTNKKNLEKTASDLRRNEKVLNALVKHATDDPQFQDVVGFCFRHAETRREGTENIVRLRADCMYAPVVEDQDVLCSALSIVFRFWLDQDFFVNRRMCVVFNFSDVERIEEKEREMKKLCDEEERGEKKTLESPKRNTPPLTQTRGGYDNKKMGVAFNFTNVERNEEKEREMKKKLDEEREMKNMPPLSRRLKKALESPKRNTTPHTQTHGGYDLLDENHIKTNDEACENALRIVSFFLEAAEGSFVPEGRQDKPQLCGLSLEVLECLSQKLAQKVNMVKQFGSAQTPEKENTPQVAPLSLEFLECLKQKIAQEVNMVKQFVSAQTPEKEHTPQVAPVSRNESCSALAPVTAEDLEPLKKRARLERGLGAT